MFQAAWAVGDRVTVHVLDRSGRESAVVPMPIARAGTRSRYYRRERPDGSYIDDTEASLAYLEDRATPALRRTLLATAAVPSEDKGGLAQFVGAQMVRGPRFFEQRTALIEPFISEAPQERFTASAVRAAGGDIERVRTQVREAYAGSTQAHMTMLAAAVKLGMVLANMRWELLTFSEPLLAYSDHPVVVWPGLSSVASPQSRQTLGPLDAFEILMPLGPELLLVASWIDQPDPGPDRAEPAIAAQANAFVVAQAERQWMHRPDAACPIASGPFAPITSQRTPGYDARKVHASVRRAFARRELAGNRHRQHMKRPRMIDI